jgi:uncharacterized protein YjbI with pentapeptide repeats
MGVAICAAVIILFGVIALYLPEYLTTRSYHHPMAASAQQRPSAADVATLQNEIRKVILQTLGGILAIAALYFTYRRVKVAEQSHITERFTKAIEQLGAMTTSGEKNIPVRLGAIYALERIAQDSPRDHWPIMEVLTAYVRHNSPAPPDSISTKELEKLVEKGISTDVQAILSVLGRRETGNNREKEGLRLDLSHCALFKANMRGSNFRNGIFDFSYLIKAHLEYAHLEGADLNAAHLEDARMYDVHLEGAHLGKLSLEETHMEGAKLYGAYLMKARFFLTYLKDATLDFANVEDARFIGVHDLTVAKIRKAINWRSARFDKKFRAQLEAEPGKDEDTPAAVASPAEPKDSDS